MLTSQQYAQAQAGIVALKSIPEVAALPTLGPLAADVAQLAPFVPAVVTVAFNWSRVCCLVAQWESSRYTRYQRKCVATADPKTWRLQFHVGNLAAGGAAVPGGLQYPRYGLRLTYFDPGAKALGATTEVASYTRAGTESAGVFACDMTALPSGLHLSQIVAYDASGNEVPRPASPGGESQMPFWLMVDLDGTAKDYPFIVRQTGSRFWEVLSSLRDPNVPVTYQYALVPKELIDESCEPLAPRVGVPFNTALDASQITRINVLPPDPRVPLTVAIDSGGRWLTDNMERYFVSQFTSQYPLLPEIDGVRGVARIGIPTMLKPARNGQVEGMTAHSRFKFDPTGAKRTLWGMRHRYVPYWEELRAQAASGLLHPATEIVGNFEPSIPTEERNTGEAWGHVWDPESLALDPSAQLIGGESPHVMPGPREIVTVKHGGGYLLEAQYDGSDRTVEPTLRRIGKTLDGWDAAWWDGGILVTERAGNRLSLFNRDGTLRSVVFAYTGPSLGSVDQKTHLWQLTNFAACRKVPIYAPEGLALLPGGIDGQSDDIAFVGSIAQRQIIWINLKTLAYGVACRPFVDNNSAYVTCRVSDGTFGPRGTIFVTSWSVANNGRPQAFLPIAGVDKIDGTALSHALLWRWNRLALQIPFGPGGKTTSASYGVAIGLADGVLLCGSADSLDKFVQRLPALDGDDPDLAQMRDGGNLYMGRHEVLHGVYGNGMRKLALPWGEDAREDYAMQRWGHTQ